MAYSESMGKWYGHMDLERAADRYLEAYRAVRVHAGIQAAHDVAQQLHKRQRNAEQNAMARDLLAEYGMGDASN